CFFSSRRRHTRFSRDWSSDVCSSDLEIRVTDHGIGISKELQEQLFEKFFRVEESSNRFQGLGIGLYICQEVIQRHEGTCGVISELGNGSTFYFRLPLKSVD